jgi:hypothetical protein
VNTVKSLLVLIIEAEDVSDSYLHRMLAPHLEVMLAVDVPSVGSSLASELELDGSMTPDGMLCINAAVDYAVSWLEEVVEQNQILLSRNQRLLQSILESTRDTQPESLERVIIQNRMIFDSSFLNFLADERSSNSASSELLTVVESRVRSELESLTAADAQAFAEILSTSPEIRPEAVKTLVSRSAPHSTFPCTLRGNFRLFKQLH